MRTRGAAVPAGREGVLRERDRHLQGERRVGVGALGKRGAGVATWGREGVVGWEEMIRASPCELVEVLGLVGIGEVPHKYRNCFLFFEKQENGRYVSGRIPVRQFWEVSTLRCSELFGFLSIF